MWCGFLESVSTPHLRHGSAGMVVPLFFSPNQFQCWAISRSIALRRALAGEPRWG